MNTARPSPQPSGSGRTWRASASRGLLRPQPPGPARAPRLLKACAQDPAPRADRGRERRADFLNSFVNTPPFLLQRHCERPALSCFQGAQLKLADPGDSQKVLAVLTKKLTRRLPNTNAGRRQEESPVRVSFLAHFICTD